MTTNGDSPGLADMVAKVRALRHVAATAASWRVAGIQWRTTTDDLGDAILAAVDAGATAADVVAAGGLAPSFVALVLDPTDG